VIALLAAAAAAATAIAAPVPDYGIAEGQCRAHEGGPAIVATATGLKDRHGTLRLELYAPVEGEFLADDRDLVRDGKVFRRAVIPVPVSGPVELCVRVPHAGAWSLALIHDRAGSKKFKLSSDGIGFSGNPRLGLSKPKAEAAEIAAGPGVTRIDIRLNYRRGLLSFGPIDDPVR
jgi:uncharacterized protein (DUF2141 family)